MKTAAKTTSRRAQQFCEKAIFKIIPLQKRTKESKSPFWGKVRVGGEERSDICSELPPFIGGGSGFSHSDHAVSSQAKPVVLSGISTHFGMRCLNLGFFSHQRGVTIAAAFARRGDSAYICGTRDDSHVGSYFLGHVQTNPSSDKMSRKMLIRKVSHCFCYTLLANNPNLVQFRIRDKPSTISLQRSLNLPLRYFFLSKLAWKMYIRCF